MDKETPQAVSPSLVGRLVPLAAGLCAGSLLLPPVQMQFYAVGFRWLYVLLVSYMVAVGLTPLIREVAFRIGAVDHPSPRKIHRTSTPLLGGVAVYFAFLIAVLANTAGMADPLIVTEGTLGILTGGTLLFLVGIKDDIREIPAFTKLTVQIIAAGIVIWSGRLLTLFPHGLWGDALNVLVTVLWIVGITNAFNFSDGMDGLATGLAVIIAFFLGVVAFRTNQPALGWIAVALIGAGLGFLPYNLKLKAPATIFLGDAGSTFLGFTLACLAVKGNWADGRPIVSVSTPILIFGVLIYDMIHTSVERMYLGKVRTVKEFLEYVGKDHLHHRLERALGSRREAVLMIFLLSIALGLAGVVLRNARTTDALLLLLQATIIVVVVSILERRGRAS
ncbi:MAG TPA: MraY family glycosyltransferase [Nitrospirales bacterium]|nr:MraY family glycosyltransferase [Nitrospirales bacterium]